MESIIVVFPKQEDSKNIRNILVRNGIDVDAVCTTGAQVLECANSLDEGIVVCSYRFSDMYYTQLREQMPTGFEMLLVASQAHWMDENGTPVMKLGMPVKVFDLVNTVHMMLEASRRRHKQARLTPKARSDEEKQLIRQAKGLLMDRNGMTEDEAHKYMQKCSMDSGTGLVETAQMVICLYKE